MLKNIHPVTGAWRLFNYFGAHYLFVNKHPSPCVCVCIKFFFFSRGSKGAYAPLGACLAALFTYQELNTFFAGSDLI